jgi:hypothetical protein
VLKRFGIGKGRNNGAVRKRPKIYVRRNGSRYVKANELLQSEGGREAIEKMRRIGFGPKPTADIGATTEQQ